MLDEQSKGQHVTVNGLVTDAFTCIALFIRKKGATLPIWSGKTAMGWGGAPLAGQSWGVLTIIEPLMPVIPPTVGTTPTGALVTTLLDAEDTG